MKRILLLISALMLSCIALWAHDVVIGGIYYYLYETNKTAEVTYRGNSPDSYNEYSGSVTIPKTITYNSEIYSVTTIGDNAFSGCSGLTSVTIPNSVTSICEDAFYNTGIYEDKSNWDNGVLYIDNCLIKAKSDVVKDSYTIKKGTRIIGEAAFYNCSGLTSVTIPNSVTSIGKDAFNGCWGLTKVNYLGTVDKWVEINFVRSYSNPTYYTQDLYINNELLTDVKITTADSIKNNAFNNCKSIKSVKIGNSVTSIESAFFGCSGLTSVTIPNSVTTIGAGAFSGCSGLTSVIWNVKNCKYFSSSPFDGICSNITSFTFGNEVEHIPAYLCYGMSKLTEITIPNSVTTIGYEAFYNCSGLTSVTIPNSVTSIGQYAFKDCSGLTSVIWNAKNCEDFEDDYKTPFYGIRSNITSFTFGNEVEHIPAFLCMGTSNLKTITIPNSVISIGKQAFYKCQGLTSVSIGYSVTSIDNYAFKYCSGLTSITIPNSVTSIGKEAFSNCDVLTSVIWNAKNCEDFKYDSGSKTYTSPFYNIRSNITSFTFGNEVEHIPAYLCYYMNNLKEVTIGKSVTSIGSYAFDNCSGLTKVNYLGTVDKWVEIDFKTSYSTPTYYARDLYINNELLTDVKITTADSIKYCAFKNCKSIKSVKIGNSVTSIGYSAFSGCSGLTSVTIGESVTSIGEAAFYNCSGLTSVSIGESVTSIGYEAFYNCSGLTSVTIPNSVTSIGQYAFKGCSGLTEVSIGESVTSIDSYAFYGCDKLRKVTAYPTTVPNVYENSFAHYNAALYVPCDVYDDYFFDDVFGTFKVTECIAAEEVDAPEKVEIEVDEDNNANVIWPSTDGAKKYELEISKDGEVFCTLLFNENGQLTSIDFGNRSASVGFQFTVTGLDGASKYAYSMVAMDKKGNELQSYKGTFTTNGYVPGPGEEDEPVSITETLTDANITVSGGTISADADFSIYNTIGQDVTAFNGSLQPGVYLISIENNIVKVMVK